MSKKFKNTKIGKILGGLGKVAIAGVADFVPGGETIVRLVSKTPEDQESTNSSDLGRIIVVVIIGISIIGLIMGKLNSDQLDSIIESLGK